jgi:hypothetical protein
MSRDGTEWQWDQLRLMKVGGNESATKFFQQNGGSAALNSKDPKTKYHSSAATKYKEELKKRAARDAKEYVQGTDASLFAYADGILDTPPRLSSQMETQVRVLTRQLANPMMTSSLRGTSRPSKSPLPPCLALLRHRSSDVLLLLSSVQALLVKTSLAPPLLCLGRMVIRSPPLPQPAVSPRRLH